MRSAIVSLAPPTRFLSKGYHQEGRYLREDKRMIGGKIIMARQCRCCQFARDPIKWGRAVKSFSQLKQIIFLTLHSIPSFPISPLNYTGGEWAEPFCF
ncbi:hypothetical protein XELAEV_18034442mg [Xenopus laevis]|uniref:Uncharacterized protein n=1 Tax=Xenopus laevis TaxID=8355 RepID=A0A974HB39_XENLA|nr:hypothetical protein XELAEV_18034442mg [Xenopus laevis]